MSSESREACQPEHSHPRRWGLSARNFGDSVLQRSSKVLSYSDNIHVSSILHDVSQPCSDMLRTIREHQTSSNNMNIPHTCIFELRQYVFCLFIHNKNKKQQSWCRHARHVRRSRSVPRRGNGSLGRPTVRLQPALIQPGPGPSETSPVKRSFPTRRARSAQEANEEPRPF